MGNVAPSTEWLQECTLRELSDRMDSGELTSVELVMAYMEHIAAFDRQGPRLNSILEMNPDALDIARALDVERSTRGPKGALHGIPVFLKDNIDTCDKMHCSAGSLALADSCPEKDSFVAFRLREAGAVILGKTNMTEWANFMTDGMPNGYSSRGGQVLNPYGPGKFDVGGSSSGSGAAVAANLAVLAVGTETSGSILSPACSNSIVGIKPTVGLVSRAGIIPISHVQDTAGPLARTVTDAAILLGVLAGQDPSDPATLAGPEEPIDYTKYLDPLGLKGIRIGYPRHLLDRLDLGYRGVITSAIDAIEGSGGELVEIAMPARPQWRSEALKHEFKVDLNAYLRRLPPEVPVNSLREVIKFNTHNPEKMLKYGQTILVASEATDGTLGDPRYIESRLDDLRSSRAQGIDRLLREHCLDAIVFPQIFGAAIAARAGYPSLTVPAGYGSDGNPLGVMFTAGAYSEPLLIKIAYAFEQVTKARRAPIMDF